MSQYFKFQPPFRVHSSKAVSPEKALELISTYLENTENDEGLSSGAISAGAGTATGNPGINGGGSSLTIHNLRRIQAALRGEFLAPSPKPGDEDALDEGDMVVPETPIKNATGEKRKRTTAATAAGGDGDGWQDREEYEQQQQEVEGEIGERMPNVVQGEEAVANLMHTEKSTDKEARKKAKKERKSKDKKDRERKRRDAAEA